MTTSFPSRAPSSSSLLRARPSDSSARSNSCCSWTLMPVRADVAASASVAAAAASGVPGNTCAPTRSPRIHTALIVAAPIRPCRPEPTVTRATRSAARATTIVAATSTTKRRIVTRIALPSPAASATTPKAETSPRQSSVTLNGRSTVAPNARSSPAHMLATTTIAPKAPAATQRAALEGRLSRMSTMTIDSAGRLSSAAGVPEISAAGTSGATIRVANAAIVSAGEDRRRPPSASNPPSTVHLHGRAGSRSAEWERPASASKRSESA